MNTKVEVALAVENAIQQGKIAHERRMAEERMAEQAAREVEENKLWALWELLLGVAKRQIEAAGLPTDGLMVEDRDPLTEYNSNLHWNTLLWFLPGLSVPVRIQASPRERVDVIYGAVSSKGRPAVEWKKGRWVLAPESVVFSPTKPMFELDWDDTQVSFGWDDERSWWHSPEIPVYIASTRESDFAKAQADLEDWLSETAHNERKVELVPRLDLAERVEQAILLAEAGDATSAGLAAIALILRDMTLDVKNVDNW